jgi:hypothetical protein
LYKILKESSQSKATSFNKLFTLIEANKEKLFIETYSLSQTTLEELFLSFINCDKNAKNSQPIDLNSFSDESVGSYNSKTKLCKRFKFPGLFRATLSISGDNV